MRLVIVESPYAGDIERNTAYARACLADCLRRGEAPYASHLLYTQPGVLRDHDPEERKLGIAAGLEWGRVAEATVVYVDLGITEGMRQGIKHADVADRAVEFRGLQGNQPDDCGYPRSHKRCSSCPIMSMCALLSTDARNHYLSPPSEVPSTQEQRASISPIAGGLLGAAFIAALYALFLGCMQVLMSL